MTQEEKYDESDAKEATKGTPKCDRSHSKSQKTDWKMELRGDSRKSTETNPSRHVKVWFSLERSIKICYLQRSVKCMPKIMKKGSESDSEAEK